MKGSGKSLVRTLTTILLFMGMFLGQISAESKFEKCYYDCIKPRPGDVAFRKTCWDKCKAQGSFNLDNQRKTFANKNSREEVLG
ncbi:hypothetical protein MKW94_000554 [Papaver nudicaule]|uniref:Uncharacterized protein n=1 Tax=Papaver nudicaule TaxID=74823 RepID=A0AA41VIV2_PAPNU|nr:hypothetical protein [Papaver nudicaule]